MRDGQGLALVNAQAVGGDQRQLHDNVFVEDTLELLRQRFDVQRVDASDGVRFA